MQTKIAPLPTVAFLQQPIPRAAQRTVWLSARLAGRQSMSLPCSCSSFFLPGSVLKLGPLPEGHLMTVVFSTLVEYTVLCVFYGWSVPS